MDMGTPPNGSLSKWAQWVSQTIVIPLLGFFAVWVLIIQLDMTEVKSKLFSASDALAHERRAAVEITAIWREIADLRELIATLPPPEFRERVSKLDDRIRAVEIQAAGGRNP